MIGKASDLFWDVFQGGGARSIDCACGREHFTRKPNDWDDERDLELMLNRECAMPDRVVGTDDDGVGYATVNGVVLCYGCPCGGVVKYEAFLVAERMNILRYFSKMAQRATQEAEELNQALASLAIPAAQERKP